MRNCRALTESQRFRLRIAGVVSLLFIAAIALMVIPQNGILRDPINHTRDAITLYLKVSCH